MIISGFCTNRSLFFVNRKEQTDVGNALFAKFFRRKNLGRDNSFCITRTATVNLVFITGWRNKRGDRIHMS